MSEMEKSSLNFIYPFLILLLTLASGGSPMFPLVVHLPASPSIWPAVQSLRRGLSTNPGVVRMWVQLKRCVDVTEGA